MEEQSVGIANTAGPAMTQSLIVDFPTYFLDKIKKSLYIQLPALPPLTESEGLEHTGPLRHTSHTHTITQPEMLAGPAPIIYEVNLSIPTAKSHGYLEYLEAFTQRTCANVPGKA